MIYIYKNTYDEILLVCKDAYPQEACGFLLGRKNTIFEIVVCRNTAADPNSSFFIDPLEHLLIQKKARHKKIYILGIFHSHPDGVPAPSIRDDQDLPKENYVCLICSYGLGKEPVTRIFKRFQGEGSERASSFKEEFLQIRTIVNYSKINCVFLEGDHG